MVFLVYGVLRCSSSSNKTWYSAWLLDAATGIIPERASLVFDRERAKATKAVDQTSRSSQLDTDSVSVFSLMPLCLWLMACYAKIILTVRVSSQIQLFTSLCVLSQVDNV